MTSIASSFRKLFAYAEKVSRTDLRYLLSGGAWLAFGQISISVIAFVSSLAFAHFVSKDTFGTYRFLLSLFWTLTAVGLTGIPTALVRSVAQGKGQTYWTALRFSFQGSIPLAVCAIVISLYYALQGNYLLMVGALIIALVGPGMQASYLYGAVLEGKQAFRTNAIAGILLNFIPLLGLLAIMLFHASAPASAYLGTYLGLSVITATILSYITLRLFPPQEGALEGKSFKSLGIHLSVMNILFTLSQQADKLLVFHALGAVELAVYTFATAIPDQLRNLFGTLETLSMPRFTKRPLQEVLPTLSIRIGGFSVLVLVTVIAYVFAAPYIFHVFFPAYADAILFSQIYALSLIPIGSVVPVSLLQAHAAKRELYIYNTAIPLFQIATVAIGVYAYGIIGVLIARIISRAAGLVLSLVLVWYRASRSASRST